MSMTVCASSLATNAREVCVVYFPASSARFTFQRGVATRTRPFVHHRRHGLMNRRDRRVPRRPKLLQIAKESICIETAAASDARTAPISP